MPNLKPRGTGAYKVMHLVKVLSDNKAVCGRTLKNGTLITLQYGKTNCKRCIKEYPKKMRVRRREGA